MATTGTKGCGRRCTLLYACTFSVVAHAAGAAAALLIPGGLGDATPVPIEVSLLPDDVSVAPAPPVLRAAGPPDSSAFAFPADKIHSPDRGLADLNGRRHQPRLHRQTHLASPPPSWPPPRSRRCS